MGTGDIGDRYVTVTVEVDQKPLKEALRQLEQDGRMSPEVAEDLACVSLSNSKELVDMEFVSMPQGAACRVVMKPGRRLLDLLRKAAS